MPRLPAELRAAVVAGVALCALAGCAAPKAPEKPAGTAEPSLAPPSAREGAVDVRFVAAKADELGFDAELPGLSPKLEMVQRMNFVQSIEYCARSPDARAQQAARALLEVYREATTSEEFGAGIEERFLFERCASYGGETHEGRALLTAYATPVVSAARFADARHRFPLFADIRAALPALAEAPRAEILASPEARARAIAWLADPLEWALAETNGTAVVRFNPDARTPKATDIPISRVATNGRPFTSLGRSFAARGLLDPAKATLDEVTALARAKPEDAEQAALANERVVFFAPAAPETFPPILALGVGRLVPGFSCAADWRVYPPGSVLLLVERSGTRPRLRLVFVHDAGGAIEGPGRIDLYFGTGAEALTRAGRVRGEVEVYRLRVRDGA